MGAVTSPFTAPPPIAAGCDPLGAGELTGLIQTAAISYNLDPEVIREVARQESSFRPCVVSSKGAEGLMQLMPATQVHVEVADPFDPEQSLMGGARLLRELLDRYRGNLTLALSAYNAGPTIVDRAQGIPGIPETQNYVANILDRLGR